MPISPNQGSISGGTTVTITGVNLANTQSVSFGNVSATITANTPTSVTCVNPSGKGSVPVLVKTKGGNSNPLTFYYIEPPVINYLDATSGPTAGGNTVTIMGRYLSTANSVSFGANTATPTIVNDGQITVTAPAGSSPGSVNVIITTTGGQLGGLSYNYVDAPTLITVAPTSGVTVGGTTLTLTGTDFSTASSVTIDGTPTNFAVVSSTTLCVVTPPGTAGAVDIVVTTAGGSATAVGSFTYISGPGI